MTNRDLLMFARKISQIVSRQNLDEIPCSRNSLANNSTTGVFLGAFFNFTGCFALLF